MKPDLVHHTIHNKSCSCHVARVLHQTDKEIVLAIEDNGKGMDATRQNLKSLGIIGMQERARLVNGQCSILSTPDKGTRITVSIPKKEDREEDYAHPVS